MDYYDFVNILLEAVREKVSDNVKVSTRTVLKNNGVKLWGLMFAEEGLAASPTIYAEQYYDMFCHGIDMDEITEYLLDTYKRSRIKGDLDISFFEDYSLVRDKLLCKIISYDANDELLTDVPHRRYLDLAIVPYLSLSGTKFGEASVLIRNNHLGIWGVEEEELINTAMSNTYETSDSELIPIGCLLKSMLDMNDAFPCTAGCEDTDSCDEMRDIDDILTEEKCPMFVLTNSKRMFGSIFMAIPDVLKKCSEKLGGDFYLLPSSVHEVILIPIDDSDSYEYLSQMVKEVNDKEVCPDDILSDHAYVYRFGYGLQCSF